MKSDEARGDFGVWLRQERRKRFVNVPAAIAAVQREAGYGIAPSVWAELESGTRRPSDEQRARLTRFFGSEPTVAQQGSGDLTDLAAAIRDQTAAMRELVAALAEVQDRQQGQMDGLGSVLGDLAGTLESLRPVLAGRR